MDIVPSAVLTLKLIGPDELYLKLLKAANPVPLLISLRIVWFRIDASNLEIRKKKNLPEAELGLDHEILAAYLVPGIMLDQRF